MKLEHLLAKIAWPAPHPLLLSLWIQDRNTACLQLLILAMIIMIHVKFAAIA